MDKKPSLSQYFGDNAAPPTAQFFDEIGGTSKDMIQSIYLGSSEGKDMQTSNIFTHTQPDALKHDTLPTVSGSTITTSLPDPSTFFDNIGTEPLQLVPTKYTTATSNMLPQAMEGLSVQDEPVDPEEDRRRDAWIPSEEAKKTLIKAQSSPKGSFFPEREVLTMPAIVLEEELGDALHEACVQHLGVSAAGARTVPLASHAPRGEPGLRQLCRAGSLRAALSLSGALVAQHQGASRSRPPRHSARSLQLWLARCALLARLRMHAELAREAEPLGQLDKPDMYYQFYPEQHGARRGSLAPFALRLLLAERPAAAGRAEDAVANLYALLAVIDQMLQNLAAGRCEDGEAPLESARDRAESARLWAGRRTRVLHSLVNCALAMKDIRLATRTLRSLGAGRATESALCRVLARAGHVAAARRHAEAARRERARVCPTPDVQELVDSGLLEVASGGYQEAYHHFVKAAEQEPTNIMVANNISVCLLYLGRLKEAIQVLENAVNSDPDRGLHESLLLNLCTLYELESSNTNEKKLNLLRMLCKYKSDTIPNVLECLKLT